jgi:hypothetical protein
MRYWRWLLAGTLALPVATWGPVEAMAQESEAAAEAPAPEEGLLAEEELDELVAPIALYPDALLAQIFVAATYPLEVVKADRFIDENAGLSDSERVDMAEEQDWDPSVRVLAGGFPTVIDRMAEEIDWTEDLGDAMLAQTDDVLDAVQRMRAKAQATGYLTSNEAQVVEAEGDSISIEPADPRVVYVPSYDATAAYTTAPTAAPVVMQQGITTSDVLTTGAIAFGSAMLVDAIFDDDDDDWDDYWDGPRVIDWDDGEFYPRRDIDIDGGVNINSIDVDRRRAINDRDRLRIGDDDRPVIDRHGAWRADPERRREAHDRLAAREADGPRAEAIRRAQADRAREAGRPARRSEVAGGRRAEMERKLAARSDDGAAGARARPAAADRGARAAPRKPEPKRSALKPGEHGGSKVRHAADRGSASAAKAKLPQARPKHTVSRAPSPPEVVHKTSAPRAHAPPRKAPKHASAFHKSSGGHGAHRASARGGSHHQQIRRH